MPSFEEPRIPRHYVRRDGVEIVIFDPRVKYPRVGIHVQLPLGGSVQ